MRVEFVKEHLVFTGEDSPMANLMLSVMGAFAEFERADEKLLAVFDGKKAVSMFEMTKLLNGHLLKQDGL